MKYELHSSCKLCAYHTDLQGRSVWSGLSWKWCLEVAWTIIAIFFGIFGSLIYQKGTWKVFNYDLVDVFTVTFKYLVATCDGPKTKDVHTEEGEGAEIAARRYSLK